MIFSLSTEINSLVIPKLESIDVICLFRVENAVEADASLWWNIMRSILKQKRSVLILEKGIEFFPAWDSSQRWDVGDNWSWLAPRSLNVISSGYENNPMIFQEFKNLIKSSK